MKVVFISPCYNASKNIELLVKSVKDQANNSWELILIDDISTDNTADVIKSFEDNQIKSVINSEKKYALRNIVEQARLFEDREDVIIATIDGDDQLCNNNSVDYLIQEYEKGSEVVWTGHTWDINGMNISKEMPLNVDPYAWPWCTSHLRTFKSKLLKNIPDSNFKDFEGNWFKRGYDQALMLPILSLTNKRKYIDKICYLYNINSVSVNDRDWAEMSQISTINLVRSRKFLKK